ncbi:MAG TPA: inositol monophosphatase family protein [Bacteroidales bacterium]|nr:inositol monophosphatase family protein [Bacteroidales bacterium]
MDLQSICFQTIDIVKSVGEYIRQSGLHLQQSQIETKGTNDFVTEIDKGSEAQLVSRIQPLIPHAGFITEEETKTTKGKEYNWIIDPIDGTTNFIHGVPPHAISVALMQHNTIVLGVVYEIMMDECFYTWQGAPAYCNGKKIHVSQTESVSKSLIGTGFPYNDYSLIDEYGIAMNYFMKHSHGLRRLGSAATDLAYVACGRYDAFFEYSLKAWDIAAGIILIQQAGGSVSDFKGGSNYLFSGELIASNGIVQHEMISILQPILHKK